MFICVMRAPDTCSDTWMFPKIMVPKNHPFVHRVFHDFHHPFWGTIIFGNTHIFQYHGAYEPGSINSLYLGMVIQPLIGNPFNGYINPYHWVDEFIPNTFFCSHLFQVTATNEPELANSSILRSRPGGFQGSKVGLDLFQES